MPNKKAHTGASVGLAAYVPSWACRAHFARNSGLYVVKYGCMQKAIRPAKPGVSLSATTH
jgi:hypothetical protein